MRMVTARCSALRAAETSEQLAPHGFRRPAPRIPDACWDTIPPTSSRWRAPCASPGWTVPDSIIPTRRASPSSTGFTYDACHERVIEIRDRVLQVSPP